MMSGRRSEHHHHQSTSEPQEVLGVWSGDHLPAEVPQALSLLRTQLRVLYSCPQAHAFAHSVLPVELGKQPELPQGHSEHGRLA